MPSSDPSASFSLCLTATTTSNGASASTAAGGQQQRKIISIPCCATPHDVFQAAQQAFAGDDDNDDRNNTTEIVAMRYGFPPKLLDKDNTTIAIHTLFSNHERIQVEFAKVTTTKNASSVPSKKRQRKQTEAEDSLPATTSSPSITGNSEDSKRKPTQRAAAKAATESFAATIEAQNKILAQQQQQQTKRNNKNSKRPRATAPTKNNTNNNHPNKNLPTSSPTHSTTRYFQRNTLEAGRRLADGAAIENDAGRSPSTTRRYLATPERRNNNNNNNNKSNSSLTPWKSEDDVSVALMSALNSGGGGAGGGKVGSILRKAMHNAVSQSYEASRAVVRVAAISGHAYTIQVLTTSTPIANDASAAASSQLIPEKLQVAYDKGVEGRGQLEETVDFIPQDALVAVITAIYQSDPEALRPVRLAQLSPRVFWSLVYHTTTTTTTTTLDTMDAPLPPPPLSLVAITSVEQALHVLLPHLDWSFMKNRKRTLSEKAKENLRQQLEEERLAAGGNDDHEEETDEGLQRAQETILAVQNAMETIHDWDSQQRRNRIAQATMARLGATSAAATDSNSNVVDVDRNATDDADSPTTGQPWRLVTPTEPDEDELVACIQPTATNLFANDVNFDDDTCEKRIQWIVQTLVNDCQIHNWRELANASPPELVQRLKPALLSTAAAAAPAAAITEETAHEQQQLNGLTPEVVESWIDHAQSESVDEIMVEICDGRVEIVEQLRDVAHSGTPKDLAAWRHVPQMLWEEAHMEQVMVVASPDERRSTNSITVETLAMWCHRAHQVLQESEWLAWYATPIE